MPVISTKLVDFLNLTLNISIAESNEKIIKFIGREKYLFKYKFISETFKPTL